MLRDDAEFNADAEKLKAVGIIPVAHGSQDWIDGTLFENVVYGMNIDLYRKALVSLDETALHGPDMVAAFAELRKLINWTDPGMPGLDWDAAANLMLNAKAGFYFVGDWAIGTYNAEGFKQGTDYLCAQAQSDNGKPGFILNSDFVVFFKQKDPDYAAGPTLLAHLIMSRNFQRIFNQAKGSIPARLDVELGSGFNPCQQLSQRNLGASIKAGTVVLSMAHNMSVLRKFRGAILAVITAFVSDSRISPQGAANKVGDAVEAPM